MPRANRPNLILLPDPKGRAGLLRRLARLLFVVGLRSDVCCAGDSQPRRSATSAAAAARTAMRRDVRRLACFVDSPVMQICQL